MDPRARRQNHAAIFQKHYNPRVVSFLVAVLNYAGKYILRKGLSSQSLQWGSRDSRSLCSRSGSKQ